MYKHLFALGMLILLPFSPACGQDGGDEAIEEEMSKIVLQVDENGFFGFRADDGSPLPWIRRDEPFVLDAGSIEGSGIERVELTNIRALEGPPWRESEFRVEPSESRINAGEAVELTLESAYDGADHRLIVFNVSVHKADGTECRYVDPWDERPGI